MGRLTEQEKALLARELKPYIVPWLSNLGTTSGATGTGGLSQHDLNGPYHTGQLSQGQAPWAVSVTSFDAHITNADAHHARAHSVTSTSDHTASGLTTGQVLRASGATTFAWAQLSHSDLGGVTANQHHNQVHTITGTDHTITASQWQIVGATGTNTIGLLTPISTWAGAEAILKASSAGDLTLVTLGATSYLRTPQINTASGNLSLLPAGDIILDPGDSNILPGGNIQDDLGDYNRKFRTLYAAELYVETLVAQDVLSTIGGRIMVAPTTTLIADVSSGATTIDVKHNNITNAFVMLQAAPGGIAQFEVMKVTAGPTTITGGYRYTVTRNVDGSGANAWVSGDAVASLGASTGQGYIELTSTSTVHSHLGPTIAIYSRTGTSTWNDTKAVTALGNLRSFVDYSSDEFGLAVGNDLTLQPTTGFKGFTADQTNGIRLFNVDIKLYDSSTLEAQISQDGMRIKRESAADVGSIPSLNAVTWYSDAIGGTVSARVVGWRSGGSDERLAAYATATGSDTAIATLEAGHTGGDLAAVWTQADSSTSVTAFFADSVQVISSNFSRRPTLNSATIYPIWDSGNDGSGSGLDADKLDTYEATAFALLNGRSGGQTLKGGTASGDDLYIESTSHSTKGDILLAPNGGNVSIGNGIYAANATLEITKSGYATVGPTMRLNNSSVGAVGDATRIEYYNAGSPRAYLEWQIISGGSAKWLFYDAFNSATRLEIGGDGLINIGAATNTYSAKLAVSGNIHAYSGAVTAATFLQVAKVSSGTVSSSSGFARIWYDTADGKLKYNDENGNTRIISYT